MFATVIVALILSVFVLWDISYLIRLKKSGKSIGCAGCSGNCSSCAAAARQRNRIKNAGSKI